MRVSFDRFYTYWAHMNMIIRNLLMEEKRRILQVVLPIKMTTNSTCRFESSCEVRSRMGIDFFVINSKGGGGRAIDFPKIVPASIISSKHAVFYDAVM